MPLRPSEFNLRETKFCTAGMVIPSMTNAQKIALVLVSAATQTNRQTQIDYGQSVRITDAFVITGTGSIEDGQLYIQSTPLTPKGWFARAANEDRGFVDWETDRWIIYDNVAGDAIAYSLDEVDYPWQATTWVPLLSYSAPTIIHPPVQTLHPPSTVQGGVFVDAIGLFTDRGLQSGGKKRFTVLGSADTDDANSIIWATDRWVINSGGTALYYSLSNTLVPDLASNWKNADNSPASITVSSVSKGELAAGMTTTNAGSTVMNGVWGVGGTGSNRNIYLRPDASLQQETQYNGRWFVASLSIVYASPLNSREPFPWLSTQGVLAGSAPAPTVLRNDIAAELNWL